MFARFVFCLRFCRLQSGIRSLSRAMCLSVASRSSPGSDVLAFLCFGTRAKRVPPHRLHGNAARQAAVVGLPQVPAGRRLLRRLVAQGQGLELQQRGPSCVFGFRVGTISLELPRLRSAAPPLEFLGRIQTSSDWTLSSVPVYLPHSRSLHLEELRKSHDLGDRDSFVSFGNRWTSSERNPLE